MTGPDEGARARRRATIAAGVAVVAAAVLAYAPALRNGFVNWDDDIYVTGNPVIQGGGAGLVRYAFLEFHASNWHPLTWLSHALDVAVWGADPAGHHLTSILLHALDSLLVFLVALRLLATAGGAASGGGPTEPGRRGLIAGAATTGLLFALHPIHVESVAWVAERKDVLSAFFYLASLFAWTGRARSSAGAAGLRATADRRTWAALGLFALALAAKPMAVTLPAVLLILDGYPFGRLRTRGSRKAALLELVPFAVLALAAGVVAVLAQRAGESIVSVEAVSLGTRLLVAANAVVAYLGKLVAPVDLLAFYPHPQGASLASVRYLASAGAVIAATGACVATARRQPWWLAAWLAFLATLLPVLGIVQAGGQWMADRYLYLPSIPPFLLAGAGVAQVARLGSTQVRRVAAVAAVLVLAALTWSTVRQVGVWRSSIDLWSHLLAREPRTVPLAYYNRGQALLAEGRVDEAIADYSSAASLNPRYRDAFFNRAVAYERRGDLGRAIADYREAIRLQPAEPRAHNNLGVALARSTMLAEALTSFGEAVRLDPSFAGARLNLALALAQSGREEEAVAALREACRLGSADACRILDSSGAGAAPRR